VEGRVAASTQSQALSAIVFLYQQVLKQTIGSIDDVAHAKQPHRIPVVLTQDEVRAVLAHLSDTTWIMATLLYGAGLRLLECLRLRVKDVGFTYNHIVVRDGKGRKDRVTMLPQQVKAPLQRHLHDVQHLHVQDVQAGAGHVYLPYALERKYPNANREWVWQYVFPPRSYLGTHGRASSGGITSTSWSCSGRCTRLSGRQRSPKQRVVIRCATRL
jgi:site-specific recombinase XerD